MCYFMAMSEIILSAVVVLILILANGVLAMAEIAIVSSRKARLQQRAEEGDAGARAALELATEPGHFLSTVQVGITLVGILAGAYGGATVAERIEPLFRSVPLIGPHSLGFSIGLVVAVITLLSVVLGELVPKRVGLAHAETLAAFLARPMRLFSILTYPLVGSLSWGTDSVFRLMGIQPSKEPPVTEEEIKIMIEQGTEAGVFEEAEQDMVESVFRLGDRRVSSLMTPRTDIVWLDADDPAEANWRKMAESGYSYFPVYRGGQDNVLGIVSIKDVWASTVEGRPAGLETLLSHPLFVSEYTTVLKLLELFRKTGRHLALIIDEYNILLGLVTLKDLLEAIVGDLPAEDEPKENPVIRREDGSWLMDGMLPVERFKEEIGLDELPGEKDVDFQSLGGFVTNHVGRIPLTGDHFDFEGFRCEVVDMDGRRVDKVLVTPLPAKKAGTSGP